MFSFLQRFFGDGRATEADARPAMQSTTEPDIPAGEIWVYHRPDPDGGVRDLARLPAVIRGDRLRAVGVALETGTPTHMVWVRPDDPGPAMHWTCHVKRPIAFARGEQLYFSTPYPVGPGNSSIGTVDGYELEKLLEFLESPYPRDTRKLPEWTGKLREFNAKLEEMAEAPIGA